MRTNNYFVRTTGDRELDNSYSQIEYELLIDKEHKPLASFIKQLEYISDYDAVLLEDDCILCKDFKKRIEEIINQYPNKIINFFTSPKDYFTTIEDQRFCYNQCTYYPKGVAKEIAKIMAQYPNFTLGYDVLEARAIKQLGLTVVRYRPCLVQHLDNDTFISKFTNHERRTPFFIDYLDELGINYEQAKDRKQELEIMLDRKFKKEQNIE